MSKTSEFIDSLSNGVMGFWEVPPFAKKLPGILKRHEEDQLTLEIQISKENLGSLSFDEKRFINQRTKNIEDALGVISGFGFVSLINCHISNFTEYLGLSQSYKIVLKPREGWIGTKNLSINSKFSKFSVSYNGIDVIAKGIKTTELRRYNIQDASRIDLISDETFHTAFLIGNNHPEKIEFRFRDKSLTLCINGGLGTQVGNANGIKISTHNTFFFESSTELSINEIDEIRISFELMLSISALSPVSNREYALHVHPDSDDDISDHYEDHIRFFGLGDGFSTDSSAGTHIFLKDQALIEFSDGNLDIKTFVQTWFDKHEERYVARWLFSKALKEKTLSMSRYLDIARAVEIVGSEGLSAPYDRKQFQSFRHELSSEIAERLSKIPSQQRDVDLEELSSSLLQSINNRSFKEKIYRFLSRFDDEILCLMCENRDRFARDIRDCRDTLTHLKSEDTKLKKYENMSSRLTYKLLLLYSLFEACDLGVSDEKIKGVIYTSDLGQAATFNF